MKVEVAVLAVPNKPMVSVDVKQHSTNHRLIHTRHAVDLSQSETRFIVIFSADFVSHAGNLDLEQRPHGRGDVSNVLGDLTPSLPALHTCNCEGWTLGFKARAGTCL